MSMSITTRLATIHDAPVLAHMNALFNGVHTSAAQLAAQLRMAQQVETVVLAELAGHIAGFACLRLVPCVLSSTPYAELTELFVEEVFRRQGVGHALITYVEGRARSRGATELHVRTSATNSLAQNFYRATGYTEGAVALSKVLIEEAYRSP